MTMYSTRTPWHQWANLVGLRAHEQALAVLALRRASHTISAWRFCFSNRVSANVSWLGAAEQV